MHPDLRELLNCLRSSGVEFLVVGATALAVHGRARYTEDLDLWLKRSEANTDKLVAALREFGFNVHPDTLRAFWQTDRQMIRLGAPPQSVDILNFLASDAFDEAWKRRVEVDMDGVRVAVLGMDDLIRAKHEAGRPKDLSDLALLEEIHPGCVARAMEQGNR